MSKCPWCEYDYGQEITRPLEDEHLNTCSVFQGLPASEVMVEEGKEYVRLPNTNILVERPKAN